MKMQRTFAYLCLLLSVSALIMAANVSADDQPGVVRMVSDTETFEPPVPVPPADGAEGAPTPMPQSEHSLPPMSADILNQGEIPNQMFSEGPGGPMDAVFYSQQPDYMPYMQNSGRATEAPVIGRRPEQNPLFGPQLMFETNVDNGLGFDTAYHRANVRIPYHAVPGYSVLMADLSAAMTNDSGDLYNLGVIWRNYDETRNRVFGWNAYWDLDDGRDVSRTSSGRGNKQWRRLGLGMESLGKYIDFRANGYIVQGDETVLLTDEPLSGLVQTGNTVTRTRSQSRDNAYSGADFEIGGPLPVLGRRGINLYTGAYYLDSDFGHEAVGFSARLQALVTESATVDVNFTTDDTFGTNSWVSFSYSFPNYGESRIFQPKTVRERLADPVYRSERIHSNIDDVNISEAIVNAKTGVAWNIVYVDPDSLDPGLGTFESPYNTLQAAADANNPAIDIFRISPRDDDSNTNLTASGGFNLFDCQALTGTLADYTLFSEDGLDYIIPGISTGTDLAPLISDPNMLVGGSVVRLANENTVSGLRIDGSNAAGTVFGTGISNPLPITDANIINNTFTGYETAVNLENVSGTIILDNNTADGTAGASQRGLVVTTANGSNVDLLIRNNTVDDNATTGISVTAGPGATINADDPNGVTGTGQPTGLVGNTATNGGQGIEVRGLTDSTIHLVAESNIATSNTFNGFVAQTDGGDFNLASLRGNTFSRNLENGSLLHYLSNGRFRSVSEDTNGNGLIDAGEDLNGNGLLDEGIVSNTMNDNSIAGLCIFGQDDGVGEFDIGGPDSSLGNVFSGNAAAGIATDLQDDATAQIDALFNTVRGGRTGTGLTIVLDFIEASQGSVVDALGRTVNPFDVTLYGFQESQFDTVTNAILDTVAGYYRDIPTMGENGQSTIPDGMQLDIDFVIGDTGVAPSNGATEYYVMTIGDSATNLGGLAGQAADIGNIRNALGDGPGQGLSGVAQAIGESSMAVYTNQINQFSPSLNPPDAFIGPATAPEPLIVEDPSQTPQFAIDALTGGNLTFTRRAIGLVAAHELGHTVSLRHIQQGGSVTPTGLAPIMGTPAIDLPIQSLLEPVEFSFSGTNPGELAGEAPFVQNSIAQLTSALGLRVNAGETREGISISGTDNARLIDSTFINNTITSTSEQGINVTMADNARVEGLTIQGNAITNGGGNGIRLVADGNAFIDADDTIGGSGTNTFRNDTFAQGNTITNNSGDGFTALASNGGVIHGNLINNDISTNGGNGASLHVSNGGTLDFGTTADRIISGNNLSDNGGRGIELISNVSASTQGRIDAVVQGNTISRNAGGGIVSSMTGPNSMGLTNNEIDLVVGGTTEQANTIADNGNVGVGFSVAGNAKGTFSLMNSTITGTTDGSDPLTSGDGIFLSRADASLLTATIESVTSSSNAGNGMLVEVQGNDRNDPSQPMSGTINTVDWNQSIFDSNGANGVAIRTRGDSMLLADGQGNVVRNNAENGIDIETTENSSFGDSTDGLPPGRRVVFDGFTVTGNTIDGLWATASESSELLLEITSNRVASTSGAHAALNTNGNSSYSNNGTDGIHIDSLGDASVDVKITAETPVTATSAQTLIQNNGSNGGGNGIFIAAADTAGGIVSVTNSIISGSVAGATEDTNGNGVLDGTEDVNGNEDIDVADGDGISYNAANQSDLTLVVGGVDEGNMIQSNDDDGIALTATGQDILSGPIDYFTGVNSGFNPSSETTIRVENPRPVITISHNTIGGEQNGVRAGNGGDGISLNEFGGTLDVSEYGADPANIDLDTDPASGVFPGLVSISDGVTQSGAIIQLTANDNLISNNGQRGVNLLINGAGGERDRENGNSTFDPNRISLLNNTIVSNGTEGVYFRGDTDMNQSRLTMLANFPFPDPPFDPADERPPFFGFYDPLLPEYQGDNIGSVNGTTAFSATAADGEDAFLNLRTVQNTFLTVVGNTIQNNGVGAVSGEGLVLSVGTGAYLAADVRDNTFGGNLEEDFRTESFLSFDETYDSVDLSGNFMHDAIYHDDTAQLDLRFIGNAGNQIAISSDGATYTTRDSLKEIVLDFAPSGVSGVSDRDVALFQVDDGGNLDNPNNVFTSLGATQDIDGEFINGGFNLRGAADPLFPNIGFAPFLP